MKSNKENRYASSHECKVSKNCKVQFNKTDSGELHIKFFTFMNAPVVVTELTFMEIQNAYTEYKAMDLAQNGQ